MIEDAYFCGRVIDSDKPIIGRREQTLGHTPIEMHVLIDKIRPFLQSLPLLKHFAHHLRREDLLLNSVGNIHPQGVQLLC